MEHPAQTIDYQGLKFDSLEQAAYLHLWRTYDRLRSIEDELFSRVGLSAQQYNTLRLLAAVAPDSLPTLVIAQRLISRAPDITRLLDRLEAQGLIARERKSDNRRVVAVRITEQGLRLLADLADEVQRVHREQFGHLAPEALEQLVELLTAARSPHEEIQGRWQERGRWPARTARGRPE